MYIKSPYTKARIPRHLLLEEPYPPRSRPLATWLLIGLGIVVLSLVAAVSDAAVPTQAEPGEADAGQLLMRSLDAAGAQGDYRPALHMDSEVNFDISGMVAQVTLTQRFSNSSEHWSEAVYVFPLPETAAVNHLQMRIGDRIIRGKIKEKAAAKKVYEQALRAGKKASLVAQQRPNMFTQKIANIGPGETIEVQLRYLQKVNYTHGRFSVRFPMTLTPRYIPGQPLAGVPLAPALDDDGEPVSASAAKIATHSATHIATRSATSGVAFKNGWGWAVPTDQVADAHLITPPMLPPSPDALLNPITITATLDAGLPLASVNSEYHNLSLRREGDLHRVALVEQRVSMDRDFVLSWEPVVQHAPAAAVFSEQVAGADYAMIMLLPQAIAAQRSSAILPRDMTFIIDTSGSMGGTSIAQAKQSLQVALSRLRPQDRFNIIEFNSTHRVLFPRAMPAEPGYLQQAQAFVGFLKAGGGTEMSSALHAALSQPSNENLLRQVVFITDGSVGNETALFAQIQQQLGDTRLFTVGIGSAPNSFFMRKAAQFGRGTFTYVGDQGEVQAKMSALFQQLESPVLSDIKLQWPDGQTVEVWPRRLPDLYRGEPLVVTAKLSQPLTGELVMSGRVAGKGASAHWQKSLPLQGARANPGVGNLWARDKISALMDEKTTGASEADIKPQVLAVALAHQLVSAYTSFVAVEEKLSRPLNQSVKTRPVPNAEAKGQQLMPVAYPRTATSGPLQLSLALLSLLAGLLLRGRRLQREL